MPKEQVDTIAREVYEKFEKATGKVPQWVKVMAYGPLILKAFVELFEVIMKRESEIDSILKCKIALVVSQTLKCPFCIDVSEKMLLSFGLSNETIEKIKNAEGETDTEKEIFELIKDITLDGHLDKPELFQKLKEKFSPKQIIEIISVMCFFNYINRFNNSLAILP
ncbi:MAG: carboxymuconolactone decarboxylase family protein [Candidatus Aenigmatarchaeota archaeon]